MLLVLDARREGLSVCISGSRHSMGGQQFGTGMVVLDMRSFNRVLSFDPGSRTIEAEAGVEWSELLTELSQRQTGVPEQLGIFQKQTGADRLTLGGALASNVHGRGLTLKPLIHDVESSLKSPTSRIFPMRLPTTSATAIFTVITSSPPTVIATASCLGASFPVTNR